MPPTNSQKDLTATQNSAGSFSPFVNLGSADLGHALTIGVLWVESQWIDEEFHRFLTPFAVVDRRLATSQLATRPLGRIYPFGWQGGSATMVNMNSPNRFEVGATTGVVHVSRGVLHLESVP